MSKLKGKKIVFIAPVALIVVIVGAIYFLQPQLLGLGAAAPAQTSEAPTETPHYVGTGPTYSLKERVLNLRPESSFRYIKIGISIEFSSKEDYSKLKGEEAKKKQEEYNMELSPRAPLLQDAVTSVLTTKTSYELSSAEGKEMLRDQLKKAFTPLVGEHKIANVYFTEFTMQ